MSPIQMMYLILGIVCFFGMFIVIIIIAGKDMLFAFYRRIRPKGCEVFISNPNRQISRHYVMAKDGVFKIDGKLYVTNPNKLLGLCDDMINEVREKLSLKRRRLESNIKRMETKKEYNLKKLRSLKDIPENLAAISQLQLINTELDNKIALLQSKKESREQAYYMQRRGAYFYIENDPIPKDFYEFFTEMDSVSIENIIVRAQTKDPKSMAEIEKTLLWLKRFLLFAIIAAGIAAAIAFRNGNLIQQLGEGAIKFKI